MFNREHLFNYHRRLLANRARTEGLLEFVASVVRPGDLVLVKGSRSIGTERVVAALAQRHPIGKAEGAA